ncbi:MAG: TonB-dependent receptor, partial [Pseudomonadota bacterium]
MLDDIGGSERDLVRGKLLLRASDQTEALLSMTYADTTEGVNLVNGPDLSERRATEVINATDTEVMSYALTVTHEFSERLSLTSVTSYSDLDLKQAPIEETLSGGGLSSDVEAKDETLTQEFRLNYDGSDGKRAILGVYYNQFDEASQRTLRGSVAGSSFFRSDGYDNSFTNYAVFGEGELALSERWNLTLGARYDYEDSSRDENATTVLDPPLSFQPNASTAFTGDASFGAFLPKVAATYSFSDSVNLSFVYQRAYRPGGADIRPDTDEPVEFDPEYSNNYELAFRGLFLDGALSLSANAFYVDYTDMQIRVLLDPRNPVARFIDNAGEAELWGLEIESLWRPSPELSLYASLGTAFSELDDFLFPGENLKQKIIQFRKG